MGKEQREREQAERLGKFNVKLEVTYTDGSEAEYKAKQWVDQAGCLTFEKDNIMTIIPHTSIKFFRVMAQDIELIV